MKARQNPISDLSVDFSDPRWSYLLGVVHGDGHVARRSVQIAVGYKDQDYADHLHSELRELGYLPKIYRPRNALRLDVHCSQLAATLRHTKSNGIWTIPQDVRIGDYLSGVIDTDGHITKHPARRIVITLKRSGNLEHLRSRLALEGLRSNGVRETTSTFKGKPYEIETILWTSMEHLQWIGERCSLKHPRKAARLSEILREIQQIKAAVPLWKRVAHYLTEAPRDIEEIMTAFDLTKKQVDSVMCLIKRECDVAIIPPPRTLTKYQVRSKQ